MHPASKVLHELVNAIHIGDTERQIELVSSALKRISSLTDDEVLLLSVYGAALGIRYGDSALVSRCMQVLEPTPGLQVNAVERAKRHEKVKEVLGWLDRRSFSATVFQRLRESIARLGAPSGWHVTHSGTHTSDPYSS